MQTLSSFVDLSIVVPAYNEEQRLPPTLDRLARFLATLPLRAEIVVVDDGSKDDTCGSCGRPRTAARAPPCGAACSRRAARSA
jgi:hypothetical protein